MNGNNNLAALGAGTQRGGNSAPQQEGAQDTNSGNAGAIPNTESFSKLHHYVYPPAKSNNAEIEKQYQQMSLQLSRIRGDDSTPLIIPQQDDETVQQRRDKRGFFSLRLTSIFDTTNDINHRGVFFDPIVRNVGPCSEILIGRYTERLNENLKELPEIYKPALFKSKVVSRTHGCFKVDIYGNWYVQDLKSSSGTFLNHQRISPASSLSGDFLLKNGDVIQLGMDFRGGQEELYRCIKFRVELNNSWRLKATQYNKEVLEKMKNMYNLDASQLEDCSICLTKLKPCQPIFVSPCAHSWHYSCIRRILSQAYPQFDCPNCRKRSDLEAALESESEDEFEAEDEDHEVENGSESNLLSANISQKISSSKKTLNTSNNNQIGDIDNPENDDDDEDIMIVDEHQLDNNSRETIDSNCPNTGNNSNSQSNNHSSLLASTGVFDHNLLNNNIIQDNSNNLNTNMYGHTPN